MSSRYAIIIDSGPNRGKHWRISKAPLILGRSANCDIQIADPSISRRHAQIWEADKVIRLKDLGSSNASTVNGEVVHDAILAEGDEIVIGTLHFRVVDADAARSFSRERDEQPTPATISLSKVRFINDEMMNDSAAHARDAGYRDLFSFSRRLSTAESVSQLWSVLSETLQKQLEPEAVWLVKFLSRADDLVYQLLTGKASRSSTPESELRQAGRERSGLLFSKCDNDQARQSATLLVAPMIVGNHALGAIAVRSSQTRPDYSEEDLEYLVAMMHTFAPYFRVLERHEQLRRDHDRTHHSMDHVSGLLGTSHAMEAVRNLIRKAAQSNLNILITGETGTGKELTARMIHDQSARTSGPYVVVNCAAIPSDLFEAQLFGHVRGAFTGADRSNAGRFEEAHGGTLFLDEIGELRHEHQASLLRAIESKVINRIGGGDVSVDVRIIAATNRLQADRDDFGPLRDDLFHRLCGFQIHMPPLREHKEDIPLLATHFVEQARILDKASARTVGTNAIKKLIEADWPGNVRELRACVERAAVLAQSDTIEPEDVVMHSNRPSPNSPVAAGVTLAEAEKHLIQATLRSHGGNIRGAARTLGIARNTLYRKMQTYGIDG